MDLFYKQYGAGPPLIVLHGLLGASGNWHTLSRTVFSEHFTVYTVDQRNHGRSPHSDTFTYTAMADDLRDFMDQRGLDAAHVLGHSMGGKTAMQFALTYPERLDHLIVVDMAPRAYPPQHRPLLEALQALDLHPHQSRQDLSEALAEGVPDRRIREFVLKNLHYERDQDGYSWLMNLDVIAEKYANVNVAIDSETPFRGPALFIRGGQSNYVTDDDLPDIQRLFPEADLVTIDGAAHWVHADRPQALAEVVVSFLGATVRPV
jgi:pimeloyl-ACP methyl ester carboxylesterase